MSFVFRSCPKLLCAIALHCWAAAVSEQTAFLWATKWTLQVSAAWILSLPNALRYEAKNTHECVYMYVTILCDYEWQGKSDKEYMLWWLHHYPQQILFRKLLPVAEVKGFQVLRRWRLGFYFLPLLIPSLQHDFPLHQFLTQAFCVGFCSGIWPTNVLKVERRAVLREEWLSTYVKAHILMKKQVLSLRKPWNEYGPFPWVGDKYK